MNLPQVLAAQPDREFIAHLATDASRGFRPHRRARIALPHVALSRSVDTGATELAAKQVIHIV
jgi:hypothetical protein